jgi:hypothetical protein
MHLTRCQDQKTKTLDEFYAEISQHDDPVDQMCGKVMLSLIGRLRALPDDRHVYGLTSLYWLCLLAHDTYQSSPWFVKFIASDKQTYFIEYLMPERLAPWQKAYVRGEAHSESEAVQMILTAMDKSEGWSQGQ